MSDHHILPHLLGLRTTACRSVSRAIRSATRARILATTLVIFLSPDLATAQASSRSAGSPFSYRGVRAGMLVAEFVDSLGVASDSVVCRPSGDLSRYQWGQKECKLRVPANGAAPALFVVFYFDPTDSPPQVLFAEFYRALPDNDEAARREYSDILSELSKQWGTDPKRRVTPNEWRVGNYEARALRNPIGGGLIITLRDDGPDRVRLQSKRQSALAAARVADSLRRIQDAARRRADSASADSIFRGTKVIVPY